MEAQNNPNSSSGSGERGKSLLRHQLSSAVSFVNHGSLVNMMYSQDDEEGEDDVNVDMRGMLEVEKKSSQAICKNSVISTFQEFIKIENMETLH